MSEHRPDTLDPEDAPRYVRPRSDGFERMLGKRVHLYISLTTLAVGLASSYATYEVMRSDVEQLKSWKADHLKDDKEASDHEQARVDHLETEIQVTRGEHNTRITLLEDRYSTLLQVLARVEKKLDDQQTLLLRRQRP